MSPTTTASSWTITKRARGGDGGDEGEGVPQEDVLAAGGGGGGLGAVERWGRAVVDCTAKKKNCIKCKNKLHRPLNTQNLTGKTTSIQSFGRCRCCKKLQICRLPKHWKTNTAKKTFFSCDANLFYQCHRFFPYYHWTMEGQCLSFGVSKGEFKPHNSPHSRWCLAQDIISDPHQRLFLQSFMSPTFFPGGSPYFLSNCYSK